MEKIVLIISLIFAFSYIFATTITVNQDGTADYTQINIAVAESTDGDTIKVYPGIYEGNILMEDRHHLLIASLYHWIEVDSFKYNTIIDGELENTGFKLDLCSNITIQGFTIKRCVGTYPHYSGAGIKIRRSSQIKIYDEYITNNYASWGAGILADSNYPDIENSVDIKNTTITKNYAGEGAGLIVGAYTQALLEEDSNNSIHSNYANIGADIFWHSRYPTTIYLDTLSVDFEDDNFIPYYYYDYRDNCELNVTDYKFELTDNDIFVDAELGNNNNCGSETEPMKTITHALSRIRSNPDHTNTVYINSGTYNQEGCSLPAKNNVNIIGIGDTPTIDYSNDFFYNLILSRDTDPHILNLRIENISFSNINTSHVTSIMMLCNSDNILLNNVNFNNIQLTHSLFYFFHSTSINSKILLENVNVNNFFNGTMLANIGIDMDLINCSFKNSQYTYWGEGGGKSIIALQGYQYNPNWPTINIINTEIINNEAANNWPGEMGTNCGISTGYMTNVNIINSTISNNRGVPSFYHPSSEYGRAIQFWEKDSNVNIVNSIIYGNDEYDLGYKDPGFYEQNNNYNLNVVNSIVGTHEMVLTDDQISFESVWSDDPEFAGEEADYPFALLENSYAIDAGVMNYMDYLPEGFEFPTTDLAGNPRISGDLIDLGAYEYQQPGSSQETEEYEAPKKTKIINYPNPGRLNFRGEAVTKISLNIANDGVYKLDIYNIKGQKVRTILEAFLARGKHSYAWNGKDKNGRNVSSGTYLIKCELDGEVITTSKMTVVK